MRHPKPCKFFAFYGRCKFSEYCSFTHSTNDLDVQKEIEILKLEISELKKQNVELRETILKIDKQEIDKKKSAEEPKQNETHRSKDFKCDECNYLASTKTVLKRHVTMKHKPESKRQPTSKTSTTCVGQLDGCEESTSDYFCEESAICPSCEYKLDEILKSAPQPPNQCPCCHEGNSGDPFSLCFSCDKEIHSDGLLDSPWGTWFLDRDKNKTICVRLDL